MENCRQLLLCFSAVFHYCVSGCRGARALWRAKKLRGLRGVRVEVQLRASFRAAAGPLSASQVGGRHQRHRTGCQPASFYAEQAHDVIIQVREEEYRYRKEKSYYNTAILKYLAGLVFSWFLFHTWFDSS